MGKESIKIVFATDGIFPESVGGIQRYSANLIPKLAEYDELKLVVVHPHAGKKFYTALSNVEEVILEDINPSKPYIAECKMYSVRVAEVVDRLKPDVVYAQGVTVWHNAEQYSDRLIVNPHGLESFQAIGWKSKVIGLFFKRFQRRTFRAARYIASEGGHLTTILHREANKDKVVFLPNAVNIPSETLGLQRSFSGEKLKVFFLARFASNKGINVLMQAIQELNHAGYSDKITYELGGKGPLWTHYKESNTFSNVDFLGFIDDDKLGEHFKKADVFVFPTLFEGMPTVILEAMSYKMPVIATDVGGIPELVKEDNGYLIAKNNVEALKKAIINFYHLPVEEKKNMSEASYKRVVENFTWDKVAQEHVELFKTIVHSKL